MNRPLRVLHLIDSLKLGGVQTVLRDVLPGLAEAGLDVRLASLHGPGPFSELFSQRGIPPIHLGTSRLSPAIPLRLWRLLRHETVDVLHTHGVPSCWLGERAWASGLVPHLVQHLQHMYQGQHGQRIQNSLERFVYRRGALLLTCSHAVSDSVETPLPKRMIYNGVDTTHFQPPTIAQREEARKRFGFGPEDHVLCMTGRITREKGVLRLCEALNELLSSEPSPCIRLLVAGTGPDEGDVRAYCAEAGLTAHVAMLGFQEDVRLCLHAADTYVMASVVEGFGQALLEAMATGLPVVVADYPAALEVLHDGVNGRLFRRGAPGSLEDVLRRALKDKEGQRRMGERARRTVVERFSLTRTVSELLALYEALRAPIAGNP